MKQKNNENAKTKRDKKKKLETTLFGILTFIFAGVCSGVAGFLIGAISKKYVGESTGAFLICMGGLILLLILVLNIHIYLHELGHLLFGKLTGYQFQSIRFGSFMLLKSGGKLKVKRIKIAGTGGQCLLLPPQVEGNDYPTGLYNWGGCITNLTVAVICLAALFLIPTIVSVPGLLLFVFCISGFGLALMNGIPLASLGNDGYNARLLRKSERARKAFKTQLLINNGLTEGKNIQDMPEEWFAFDLDTETLDNTLTVSSAIMKFNYLMNAQKFEEAEALGHYLLDHAEGMVEIHEMMLKAELLFCEMMLRDNPEHAKEIYTENKKKFESLNSLPSMPRIMYGYYKLVENKEEEAKKQLALFDKLSKKYPYPVEIEGERELIRMIDEELNKRTKASRSRLSNEKYYLIK